MFHDVCDDCPDGAVAGSITKSDFVALLDWLRARQAQGTVVKTVRAVMGFPEPPLPGSEEPQPVFAFQPALPAPALATTSFASLQVRSRQHLRNLRVRASMTTAGVLSARGTITLGKRYRLRRVRTAAAPGQPVTLRLSLTKKGLRAVRRALRRHERVQAEITIVAVCRRRSQERDAHRHAAIAASASSVCDPRGRRPSRARSRARPRPRRGTRAARSPISASVPRARSPCSAPAARARAAREGRSPARARSTRSPNPAAVNISP